MINTRALKTMWVDMIRFPRLSVGAYRVWFRNFFYFKKYMVSSIFWSFTEPLLFIIAFGYGLGFYVGQINGIPYMLFLAPAILATSAMQGSVFEATYSSFTKLKVQKTYETIMMTPVSVEEVVAGEIFWAASKSFFGVLAVFIVFWIMGLITNPMAVLTLPVYALLCWCFAALSMVVTSFARDYDSFTYFFTLVVTPMSLLADTFFPITHFPVWAQRVALALPLTHGMAVARPLWLGQWDNMFLLHILYLVILSQLLTNWAINQTRRRLIY